MKVFVLNCGSSSIKYKLFDMPSAKALAKGLAEKIGLEKGKITHSLQNGDKKEWEEPVPDHQKGIERILDILTDSEHGCLKTLSEIEAVGHRVVHGGEDFSGSVCIDDEVIAAMKRNVELAPLHNPPNLEGIDAIGNLLPDVPQVGVFDTAFHQSMPPAAYTYALPHEWYERYGIRRYGFHGTSHLYVAHRAAVLLDRPLAELRLVTLHVGNGASACAVERGRAVDTSMGLTPLEGLVMGTRCGSIDPAIPLHMMQRLQLDAAAMDRVLNKQSGMLGLTGRHVDRRDVLAAAAEGDERCRTALAVEARTLAKTIGAYAAVMGGLDAVVFTAGVGENAPPIRAAALRELAFLGLQLDAGRNQRAVGGAEMAITKPQSPTAALVIPTDEERVIAEDTQAIVQDRYDTPDFHYTFARPD